MSIRKFFLLPNIFAFIFLSLYIGSISAQNHELISIVNPQSIISINGESNVSSIRCRYTSPFPSVTLRHNADLVEDIFDVNGDSLRLEVTGFDCGKRGINRDFRKTLKAGDYPLIKIWVESISLENETDHLATVSVSITGTVKTYNIPLEVLKEDNSYMITGDQEILLTDFNLKPPRALFGLVKVRDEFIVSFDLNIEQKKSD